MDKSTELTDTSDMVNLHRVFRNAISQGPTLTASAPAGDQRRAAMVASYYINVLSLLRAHHEGEDELIWPRLLERCPEQADVISRVAGQHDGVVESLAAARRACENWSASASANDAALLRDSLAELDADLIPHLDEEEELILPIAGSHLSPEEWGELPSHGMRSFDGDKLWLILGLILEQMTPLQREKMHENFPPPVAEMWANFGEQAFDEFVVELNE